MSTSSAPTPERMENLREKVRKHCYEYYVLNKPTISDGEFDILFNHLKRVEEENPELITPDSPTQIVGFPPKEGERVINHKHPFLSLDNVYDEGGFELWYRRVLRESKAHINDDPAVWLSVEPKLDGVALSVVYEKGTLAYGALRGVGTTGEDVTPNLKYIFNLPTTLKGNYPDRLEVRGEVVVTKDALEKMNRVRMTKGEKPYTTCRSAAAAFIRTKDQHAAEKFPAQFLAYQIMECGDILPAENTLGRFFDTQAECLKGLFDWGFATSTSHDEETAVTPSANGAEFYVEEWAKRREEYPYEIDGLVFKVNELALQVKLGEGNRYPHWAIAYKFPAEAKKTIMKDVIFQVGRQGAITPVVILEPVEIGGITISRANLYNLESLKELKADIGDTVIVERAADVIPKVTGVLIKYSDSTPITYPTHCPSCNTKLVEYGSRGLKCPADTRCPAQRVSRLTHYARKDAVNIDGLGPNTIEKLVEAGVLTDLASIYRLTKSDLMEHVPGMGEKKADKLLVAIEGAKEPELKNFIYGLAIEGVGISSAEELSRYYLNFENLLDEARRSVDGGVFPKHTNVTEDLMDRDFSKIWASLKEVGVKPKEFVNQKGPLSGQRWTISGAMESMVRDELASALIELGAEVAERVTKKTTHLANGKNSSATKLAAAVTAGMEILDETEILDLLKIVGED